MLATISNGFVVEQEHGREARQLVGRERAAPDRRAVGEQRVRLLEHLDLGQDLLVAALGRPALRVEALLDARDVGEHELELERDEIAFGIGGDAAVGEGAQHDQDRVAVAQRAEDLRAESLARLRPGRQGEVHELEARRDRLLRLRHLGERAQALVGEARHADRGLVLAGDGQPGEGAEQTVRARAGETHETEVLHRGAGYRSASLQLPMSKKTKKRRLKARRNKANHGKRPRAGR